MEVTVPLIARENCIKLPRPYNLVSPGAICAGYKDGGKDACTGDSGGLQQTYCLICSCFPGA